MCLSVQAWQVAEPGFLPRHTQEFNYIDYDQSLSLAQTYMMQGTYILNGVIFPFVLLQGDSFFLHSPYHYLEPHNIIRLCVFPASYN